MNLDDIWHGAQKVCGVKASTRTGNTKHARVRWLAMYVARKQGFTLPAIGKFFGMHHTSVLYAISEIEKRRVRQVAELEKFLAEPPQKLLGKGKEERNVRERLPIDRSGLTLHFTITSRKAEGDGTEEIDGYLSTGEYPDGRLGELFLKIGKHGDHHAMWDQWCQSTSIALQYGAPVEDILGRFVNTRFEPSGAVSGVSGIMRCSSPLDLIARYLLLKYSKVTNGNA